MIVFNTELHHLSKANECVNAQIGGCSSYGLQADDELLSDFILLNEMRLQRAKCEETGVFVSNS